MRYYISPPPMNPVSRFLAALLAVSVMLGAFFFGLVILVVLGALFGLFVLGVWLRSWWLRRRMPDTPEGKLRAQAKGEEIEAEYTVVSRRRD